MFPRSKRSQLTQHAKQTNTRLVVPPMLPRWRLGMYPASGWRQQPCTMLVVHQVRGIWAVGPHARAPLGRCRSDGSDERCFAGRCWHLSPLAPLLWLQRLPLRCVSSSSNSTLPACLGRRACLPACPTYPSSRVGQALISLLPPPPVCVHRMRLPARPPSSLPDLNGPLPTPLPLLHASTAPLLCRRHHASIHPWPRPSRRNPPPSSLLPRNVHISVHLHPAATEHRKAQ